MALDKLQISARDESIANLLTATRLYNDGSLMPEIFAARVSTYMETLELSLRNGKELHDRKLLDPSEILSELMTAEITRPPSILGDGLLVERNMACLYGQPGIGKTYILLMLALAVARGEPWLGFETHPTRVGFISLELQRWAIQERIQRITESEGVNKTRGLDRISLIARPRFKGAFDLLDPTTLPAILAWVKELELGLVIIDPLSRTHNGNENSQEHMGAILGTLERITEAGPAVLFNHHEGHPNPELQSQHPRGSSRLLSDPTTVLNLGRHKGSICLRCKKANLGKEPEPIYLEQVASGAFSVIDEPKSKAAAAEDARLALAELIERNPGLTVKELRIAMRINPDTGKEYSQPTISRYLSALEAEGLCYPRNEPKKPPTWHPTLVYGGRID